MIAMRLRIKLRKLRCSSNEPAGNRPAFQVREQMIGCKVPISQICR